MPEHETDHTPDTDTPLWRFALALWQCDEAASLCLSLQEKGWSVTRLLSAGWLARERRVYPQAEPLALQQWRAEMTGSLRALKKSLAKSDPLLAPLRQTLARAELEAERVELYRAWQALHNALKADPETPDIALIQQNLRRAAPCTDDGQNFSTEPKISHLAELINQTGVSVRSGACAQPGSVT